MPPTIHQKYRDCLNQLTAQRLAKSAQAVGLTVEGLSVRLPFFDRRFAIDPDTIIDDQGQTPTDAVALVLCRYLLSLPPLPAVPALDEERVTLREFSGAGPLVSSFASNTNKIIASAFATKIENLTNRAITLGGRSETGQSGYDLYMRFEALPNLPLWLLFNGADEGFASQSSLLFNPSAEHYLDMQGLFIVATYLTGQLVAP